MTQEQIEKFIKIGRKSGWPALTNAPHNLSAADASVVYFECRNREAKVSFAAIANASASPAMKLEANPVISAKRRVRAWKKHLKPGKFPANVGACISTPKDSEDALTGAVVPAVYTPSKLNRSSVKYYALEVSTRVRAGKFKRVSPSFVSQVEAELENIIRGIGGAEDSEDISWDWDFFNRKQISSRLFEQLNRAVRKIILRKVRGYPTRGQTLK